ncbi:MAG: ArsR/SmtB family transcription factor [Haloferacaceae archaeon]
MGGHDVDDEVRRALAGLYDDPDAAAAALSELPPDDAAVEGMATVFGAMANEDRLRLLATLRDGERCGCELRAALDAPQSTVSTHLRRLREAGLVTSRKSGRWRYYRLADAAASDLFDLAAAVVEAES